MLSPICRGQILHHSTVQEWLWKTTALKERLGPYITIKERLGLYIYSHKGETGSLPLLSYFMLKEMVWGMNLHEFKGQDLRKLLVGQDFERTKLEIFWKVNYGRTIYMDLSEWLKKCKISMCYVKTQQRAIQMQ